MFYVLWLKAGEKSAVVPIEANTKSAAYQFAIQEFRKVRDLKTNIAVDVKTLYETVDPALASEFYDRLMEQVEKDRVANQKQLEGISDVMPNG